METLGESSAQHMHGWIQLVAWNMGSAFVFTPIMGLQLRVIWKVSLVYILLPPFFPILYMQTQTEANRYAIHVSTVYLCVKMCIYMHACSVESSSHGVSCVYSVQADRRMRGSMQSIGMGMGMGAQRQRSVVDLHNFRFLHSQCQGTLLISRRES